MTLIGSYAAGGSLTDSLQHAHGIDLRGTSASINGVSVSRVAGDCVYFGLGYDNVTQSSGTVLDSSCTSIGRNGVSVTAGNNILIQRFSASQIGYEAFDMEPNSGPGNWGASNVTVDSSKIGTYYLYAYSVVLNGPDSNLTFTNNVVSRQGLRIAVGNPGGLPFRAKGLTITNNSSDTPTWDGAIGIDSTDGATVTGNSIPISSGVMARINDSCDVLVSGNSYPGGSAEVSIANPPSSCPSATPSPTPVTTPTASPTSAPTRTPTATPTQSATPCPKHRRKC
jgi:hypothetical protein